MIHGDISDYKLKIVWCYVQWIIYYGKYLIHIRDIYHSVDHLKIWEIYIQHNSEDLFKLFLAHVSFLGKLF